MAIKSENEFLRYLCEQHIVEPSKMQHVTAYQKSQGVSFLRALIDSGVLSSEDALVNASTFLEVEYIPNISRVSISDDVLKHVGSKIATRYSIIPVEYQNNILKVCVCDPFDVHTIDDIRMLLNCRLEFVISTEQEIVDAIKKCYGIGARTIDNLSSADTSEPDVRSAAIDVDAVSNDSSMVTFVNQLLLDSYRARATDIHIEPGSNDLKIRYRIDGVLHDVKVPQDIKRIQSNLVTRLKIISGLDISEHRLPQDGRIKIKTSEEELDLRVSVLPTPYGEAVNIRLLSSATLLELEHLGFAGEHLEIIQQLIKQPHGIILLTGPTGSGKTTTLYSCLNRINGRNRKIITIEDPIEYQMDGITQIQVHPKIGLTFSQGLRSMLRHDPDVMMVGEVRDVETAEITIRVALTGHLVFSTLHTNDAPGAISRLLDMGIEPYLVSSSVECIIAQRLVRVLCPKCKEKSIVERSIFEEMGFPHETDAEVYKSKGCDACSSTGYKGRTAIVEVMVLTQELKQLIMMRSSAGDIQKAARKAGMKSLREDGWKKISQGITSIDEVLRVTQDEGR